MSSSEPGPRLLAHPLTGARFPSPVSPGTGWPEDPATANAPVAEDADSVRRLAQSLDDVNDLEAAMSVCRACPRLVAWRENVAATKRASYVDQPYWGRPIAGWGEPDPRVLILGLAPAAHGGNRTGRIFTGDRSGDWLFASLHRVGLAVQQRSDFAGDGQRLLATRMAASVRCAPPDNRPTVVERDTCAPWLRKEITLVAPSVRVVVCLGLYAWDAGLRALRALGYDVARPKPRFGHGSETVVTAPDGGTVTVLGSYHPSQQNTFTGTLTEPMLDAVLGRAAYLGGADAP